MPHFVDKKSFFLTGSHKFCGVQIWTPSSKGMADNVRSGQDVFTLFESLEVRDPHQSTAACRDRGHANLQSQLHKVPL